MSFNWIVHQLFRRLFLVVSCSGYLWKKYFEESIMNNSRSGNKPRFINRRTGRPPGRDIVRGGLHSIPHGSQGVILSCNETNKQYKYLNKRNGLKICVFSSGMEGSSRWIKNGVRKFGFLSQQCKGCGASRSNSHFYEPDLLKLQRFVSYGWSDNRTIRYCP